MSIRTKVIVGMAMAVCGIAGLALATPQVGIVLNALFTGAINKDVRNHVFVKLAPSKGESEDNVWHAEFSTEGPSNFQFADVTIVANGGHTGWHTHPGVLLITVAAGSIEWYDANCNRTVYNAGDSLTETDMPHYVRTVGSVDARLMIVYVIPKGLARRVDIPLANIPACAQVAGIAD